MVWVSIEIHSSRARAPCIQPRDMIVRAYKYPEGEERIPMLGTASTASSHDHAAVNSQLARILESPHFRNSKRSQALLRFILESALSGDHAPLKERSIGAAVFGRDIAYDTAQDPIVRNAAIEVRKRLAQYYLEPEHAAE